MTKEKQEINYDTTFICRQVKKLTEGGGGEGGGGEGEGGGHGENFPIITSSRCKLFCSLFVAESIP